MTPMTTNTNNRHAGRTPSGTPYYLSPDTAVDAAREAGWEVARNDDGAVATWPADQERLTLAIVTGGSMARYIWTMAA